MDGLIGALEWVLAIGVIAVLISALIVVVLCLYAILTD